MSNNLQLIMRTPVEQLVPALLEWNNQELRSAVAERLTQYQGIIYDNHQIATAKADRADLNSFCKALNDERIRIGKIYNAPYDKFKAEVDQVIADVKKCVEEIDAQVKDFEQKKQEEKQNEIIEYFKSVVGDLLGLIPYERIHNPKWLNSSVSIKSVKADIDKIFEDAKNAVISIEALKSEDEDAIKAYYFRTLNLSEALIENQTLKEEREKMSALRKQHEESEQTVATRAHSKTQTVIFQVDGTFEQLRALKQFMHNNRIKYTAI